PYLPDDPPNPLSVYGRTKWAGEQNVRNSGCRYLVLRTAWMFGPGGHNFVEAIIAQAAAGDPLRVVTDQLGSPTFAVHLADAIVRLLDIDAQGTVHFTNSGQCSWFQFAEEIVRQACVDVRVYGICTADLERPARRPGYSVLDTGGYVELTGHTPVPWNDALDEYLIHRSKRGHTAAGLCAPNTESLAE
ncbi:MAG: SDR family oxidoreductase, partial [Phycisphaerae bacterium]